MPPKRKRTGKLEDPETEGLYPEVGIEEDERTGPKKRGRKSIIDAILQEEARGTPAPVLPQNQWTVSIVHSQDLVQTANTTKRRKNQSGALSLTEHKYLSPGTPSIWGANKGEFYSAFKSLTESFGGICFANLGTFPVLAWLVEGPRPSEDKLDGEKLSLSLVTEFQPKDQPGASASAASAKKKGRQNRRTKRGDLDAVLDDAANKKPWPCLVVSPVFNPDYPTFCECFQPRCPRHSPAARELLLRRCTDYSWPDPRIIGLADRSIPPEPGTNFGPDLQPGRPSDLDKNPSAPSEHKPRVQGGDPSTSISASSLRLPLNTTKAYAQVVPELASLLDHMERRDPMLVLTTTDASMDSVLPFQLPPGYGCVVLGFFNVESVECESETRPSAPTIGPGTLSWKVKLRYASPSDATDTNGNLVPPWWLLPPTSDVAGPPPSVPVPGPGKGGVEREADGSGEAPPASADARWCVTQALDGNPGRTWWHCLGCGRINQRDMLVHRRCPSCQRNEVPAPPSVIEDVLQDASKAPYPFNHPPQSMKTGDISVTEYPDGTSVYCYSFHDNEPLPVGAAVGLGSERKGACVKHVFTGPDKGLEKQAKKLFYQIQEDIELSWQSVKTGIAEGPYYSWASPRHGWIDKEIPQCIHEARGLISRLVGSYCEKNPGDPDGMLCEETSDKPAGSMSSEGGDATAESVRINHIVALAWTASGLKRGTFVSAKDNPVFILCLGATVEFELERCVQGSGVVVNIEDNPAVDCDVAVPGEIDEEPGQKAKGKKPRKSLKNPVAPQSTPDTNANPNGKKKDKGKEKAVVPQPKPKPSAPNHERLKISMVHGDVLVLSGGDFIYTLTRSGMSILLFALSDAQH